MKALFEKKKKILRQLNQVGYELDREIEKRWGFSYSETNDDMLIDTIDYGTCSLSYIEFVKKMNAYKKERDKQEKEQYNGFKQTKRTDAVPMACSRE